MVSNTNTSIGIGRADTTMGKASGAKRQRRAGEPDGYLAAAAAIEERARASVRHLAALLLVALPRDAAWEAAVRAELRRLPRERDALAALAPPPAAAAVHRHALAWLEGWATAAGLAAVGLATGQGRAWRAYARAAARAERAAARAELAAARAERLATAATRATDDPEVDLDPRTPSAE